jgi:hypothetical protein
MLLLLLTRKNFAPNHTPYTIVVIPSPLRLSPSLVRQQPRDGGRSDNEAKPMTPVERMFGVIKEYRRGALFRRTSSSGLDSSSRRAVK